MKTALYDYSVVLFDSDDLPRQIEGFYVTVKACRQQQRHADRHADRQAKAIAKQYGVKKYKKYSVFIS